MAKDIKIKGTRVFVNGAHVADITGGRYRWHGAVVPGCGYGVRRAGDGRELVKAGTFSYFRDVSDWVRQSPEFLALLNPTPREPRRWPGKPE